MTVATTRSGGIRDDLGCSAQQRADTTTARALDQVSHDHRRRGTTLLLARSRETTAALGLGRGQLGAERKLELRVTAHGPLDREQVRNNVGLRLGLRDRADPNLFDPVDELVGIGPTLAGKSADQADCGCAQRSENLRDERLALFRVEGRVGEERAQLREPSSARAAARISSPVTSVTPLTAASDAIPFAIAVRDAEPITWMPLRTP